MQTLIKVKEKADTVEKYSIEDIEPLIKDIIALYKGATEQWICKTLDYNEGYISQMRSREKREKLPQVPIKFYNQLKNFGLHYATSSKNESLGESKFEEPFIEYVENKKRSADYLAGRLDGKDDEIKQIEARRRDMELRAEKAEKEKDRLLNIIEKNLTELLKVSLHLSSNLTEVKQDTSLGLSYQRAWVEYTAEDKAQGDKKKKDQMVLHMNKLLRSQIDGGRKEGKHSDAHRQHKEG
jgi:hypothetical protein